MKNKINTLSLKSSLLKIGLLITIVISNSNLFAGVETFNTRLTATQMIAKFNANNPIEVGVEDDKFNQIQSSTGNFVTPSVKSRIILGIDHENTTFQAADYELTFEIKVSYLDASSVLQTFITNLTIGYTSQSNNPYPDKSIHQFINGHAVKAEVVSVYDQNNDVVSIVNLPVNLFLETEIEVERYYQFNPVQPLAINTIYNGSNNELTINWNHLEGAEEYELEWTYVDDYDLNGATVTYRPTSDLPVNFRNNSTRVSLRQNNYTIPLTFEHGYLLYRVRAVGRDINDIDFVLYGYWSAPSSTPSNPLNVDDYTVNNHYFIIDNTTHEENKNWQYSASYAEEGKKKEVISYFDGSLRTRQSVTKLNTNETTIVGETIYDNQGRGAVQVLPVPTDEEAIKYYEAFNKNEDEAAYNRDDFDVDNGTCDAGAKPMSSINSGASNYYSNNNPNKDNVQAYVPDAFKFPFTQVEYTPDNTGRIRRQSGVGINHQLGTDRETKYFYAQPSQRELDQLFGSEAGNKAHYKQNAVVDANKQLSVSYLDMQGRTVATSLAGATPEALNELENGTTATVNVENEDLFAKNALGISADNQPNINRDAIVFTTEKLIKSRGLYTFKYDVLVEHYNDPCLLEELCFECVYNLEITITDECGNNVKVEDTETAASLEPVEVVVGQIDTLCHTPVVVDPTKINDPLFPSYRTTTMSFTTAPDDLTAHLEVGVYTITKRLTINQGALNAYKKVYLNENNIQEGNENCFRNLQSFKDEWLSNVDDSGCEITCESCLTTLGSEEEFITKGGTAVGYAAAVKECNDLCDNTSLCEASYRMMLADVSPGGQYAQFKITTSGTYEAHMYPLSLYNYYNSLPKSITSPRYPPHAYWRFPATPYLNEDGTEARIPVVDYGGGNYSVPVDETSQIYTANDNTLYILPGNLKTIGDFLGYWKPSFAQSLVQYHPEYCYYEWCSQNSTIYGNATETSDDFDYRILGMQTITQTLNPVGQGIGDSDNDSYPDVSFLIDQDPFFNEGGIGTITPNHWPQQPPNGPQIPWGQTPHEMMENLLLYYPTGDPALSPYSIYEMVAITQSCGGIYSNDQAAAEVEIDACLLDYYQDAYDAFGNIDINNNGYNAFINSTESWESFKGMYISAKQKVQLAMANEHAYWSCYNPCIGWDEGNFWQWARINMLAPVPHTVTTTGYGSWSWPWDNQTTQTYTSYTLDGPFTHDEQPCGRYTYNLYKDKVQRFQNPQHDGDQGELLSEMGNQADFELYSQTGQCPKAFDLEFLLNALALDNQITATGVQLQSYPQFTEELYTAVLHGGNISINSGNTGFVPYVWGASLINSDLTLSIDINNTTVSGLTDGCDNDITLNLINPPTGFDFNDFEIIKMNQLKFIDSTITAGQPTIFNFTVKATIQIPAVAPATSPTTQIITLAGTTCINIDGCRPFNDVCETTEQAGNILVLMNMLSHQKLYNQTDSDIDENILLEHNYPIPGGSATSSYQFYLNPLKSLLNDTGNEQWQWSYNAPGFEFVINDANSANPSELHITFSSLPAGFPTNIADFLSIVPDQDPLVSISETPTNAFVIEYLDNTGEIKIAKGEITVVNGTTTTDVVVGTCAPPVPAACSAPENYRLDDLNAFLNELVGLNGYTTGTTIDLTTVAEYTELLASAAGTVGYDDVKWKNITVSGTTLSADIEIVIPEVIVPPYTVAGANGDINMPEEIIPAQTLSFCTVNISFINPNTTATFASIQSFDWIQADYSNLADGQATGFVGMVILTDLTKHYIKGTSCFAIANCNPVCVVEKEMCDNSEFSEGALHELYNGYLANIDNNPRMNYEGTEPLSYDEFTTYYICCWDDYKYYAYLFNVSGASVFNPNSPLYVPLEEFCQYKDCAIDHYNYLKYASDNWGLMVEGSPYFVTLSDFCTYNELYGLNNPIADYKAYVQEMLAANNESLIVSYVEFVQNNLGVCKDDYLSCLAESSPNPLCYETTLMEYCEGGYQTLTCTPTPVIEEPITIEYVNNCREELDSLAILNAEGEYQQYIENITEDFRTAYKEKCLKAFENFTVSYEDKEHHFTLYYYDQAGNLIRTIPPAGVSRIVAQEDFDQINADRTFGTKTYFTQHTYPTTYEYNSLNQLVSQNIPDHNLINDVTVSGAANIPTTINGVNVNVTGVQYTSNGAGYAFVNDGTDGYIYVTTDNGATWSQLSSVGNQDLNAIYMINANEGYAVGENGILLRTTDGGNQWIEVTSFTTETLNDVIFLDVNTGITVGENGTMFTTTDAGVNWTQISGLSGNVVDIEFYTATDGYAVVQEGNQGVIYAIDLTLPTPTFTKAEFINPNNLNAIQMHTPLVAYAAGDDGQLLYTNNGGNQWELINNGITENFKKIHFKINTTNGCAITEGGKLLATTNNGKTWVQVNPPGSTGDYVDFHFINSNDGFAVTDAGKVTRIDFTQAASAWALLPVSPSLTSVTTLFFENISTGYVASGGTIAKTTDGGLSWSNLPQIDTRYPESGTQGLTSFVNQITAIHFNGNEGVIIADGKNYYTNNGGELIPNLGYDPDPQVSQAYPNVLAYTSWFEGSLTTLLELEFIDNTTGFARNASGDIYQISNGGATWTPIANTGTINDLSVVESGGLIHGAVVGDNGDIRISTDILDPIALFNLKTTIQPQNLNGIALDINGTSNEAYAVGNDGKIFKTSNYNDGISSVWQLQPTASTAKLHAVDLKDPNTVSAVGQGGTILTSTGGAWVNIPSGTTNDLNDVYYITNSIAYAVGNGGVVLENTTGNWNIVPSTMTENLNSVHVIPSAPLGIAVGDGGKIHRVDGSGSTCVTNVTTPVMNASQMVTNLIGYAVGENGVILKTTDAGVSWNVLVSPLGLTNTSLNAVFFTTSDYGYFVGNGGVVYQTDNGGATWTVPSFSPSAPTDNLNDIYFADATHGVIVGDNGMVYHLDPTTGSWNQNNSTHFTLSSNPQLTNLSTISINAVYAVNGVWFIVGDASTMFKMTDYGVMWNELFYHDITNTNPNEKWTKHIASINDFVNLNDVYFSDQYHGWILGDNGTIIKTKDGGATWEQPLYNSTTTNLTAFNFNADGEAIIVGNTSGGSTAAFQFSDQSDRFSTKFWYDKLGRLIVSQNTKQHQQVINNVRVFEYSYTIYDALGRIKEVGAIDQSTPISSVYVNNQITEVDYLNWINAGTRKQITNTYYDLPLAGLTIPNFTQNNLRTRVASTTFKSSYHTDPLVYDNATHYSYDIHGNVDVLIQDNTTLEDMNQRYKRMDYDYDLISGNVNEVAYQKGEPDQFFHKYEYDADNRITNVYTSSDAVIWNQDAKYQYYLHGPLARTEIGDLKVQGIDYAYTIQGWLKGVNSNTLVNTRDIGKDGVTTNINQNVNQNVAQDEFGFTLGYFNDDYSAINSPAGLNSTHFEADLTSSDLLASTSNLYNGNIGSMVTAVRAFMQGGASPNATAYKYDQLNRLKEAKTHNDAAVVANNQWSSATTSTDNYGVKLTYDDNGNILTLKRNSYINTTPNLDGMDNMTYDYEEIGPRKTNRLKSVIEQAIPTGGTDIQPGTLTFEYDEIGNLIQDDREEIENIEWSVSGKILKIERTNTSIKPDLEFVYDASGNRTTKIVKPRNGVGIAPEKDWTYTYYVRDASGNVMSVYEKKYEDLSIVDHYKAVYKQKEVSLYGSSRIGMQTTDKILAEKEFTGTVDQATSKLTNIGGVSLTMFNGNSTILSRTIGNKQYELTNHLGNVLATVSDLRYPINNSGTVSGYEADVASANLYYPFGSTFDIQRGINDPTSVGYRYGFNGKESDNEVSGNGNSYDYGFRIYNPRIAKFLSVDPLTDKYAMLTPYQFASNKPITSIDLDGLESYVVISMPQEDGKTKLITKSWKELGKKEIHGGKGMGVSFYNYDPKTKKAVFQEFKNFNQLGMGPKESVKRDAGLALESFGEAVEMGGYFVNIIPHPLAKVLGAGLQAGGEASQLLGTSLQVSADLDDENYGEVGFTVSKTLLFGGLKKTVGNLKEQGKISGNDETILNGLLFGNEKVVDKFNSVAKKKSSESSSSQSATPSNSKESTSNSDLNIQVDE